MALCITDLSISAHAETPSELGHLVEVYHRHGIHRRAEDFWAWERVHEIVTVPTRSEPTLWY
jgi:hypothetical protein